MQKYSKVFKNQAEKHNEILYLTELLERNQKEPMKLIEKTIKRSLV
mgnify:CR=1